LRATGANGRMGVESNAGARCFPGAPGLSMTSGGGVVCMRVHQAFSQCSWGLYTIWAWFSREFLMGCLAFLRELKGYGAFFLSSAAYSLTTDSHGFARIRCRVGRTRFLPTRRARTRAAGLDGADGWAHPFVLRRDATRHTGTPPSVLFFFVDYRGRIAYNMRAPGENRIFTTSRGRSHYGNRGKNPRQPSERAAFDRAPHADGQGGRRRQRGQARADGQANRPDRRRIGGGLQTATCGVLQRILALCRG